MSIVLVSIGVVALALLLLVIPVIALQLALRSFRPRSAGQLSMVPESADTAPALEVPSRPLEVSRASS